MTESSMPKIIPTVELETGMKVGTPDGKSKAVVESRDEFGFALHFHLIDGQEVDVSTLYGFGSAIKLILDQE